MQAHIAIDGTDTDFEALWDWLRREPELRGRLRTSSIPALPGAMGATTEVVVQVASTVAGASAVWAALAKSLSDWLKQRRSDVSIEITLPGGEHVSVSGSRLDDPEAIIQMAFDKALEASRPAAEDE